MFGPLADTRGPELGGRADWKGTSLQEMTRPPRALGAPRHTWSPYYRPDNDKDSHRGGSSVMEDRINTGRVLGRSSKDGRAEQKAARPRPWKKALEGAGHTRGKEKRGKTPTLDLMVTDTA